MLLLPYPAIDPVALAIGPVKIHWYGIAYVAGILLAWRYCAYILSRFDLPFKHKDLDDFIPLATLGIVVGGRLGHALFYSLDHYLQKPWEVFYIWHPGMSFHGGLLGVIIVALWFTAKRQIPRWTFGDVLAAGTPIGLFFGRIANFINGELFGRPTDVEWAMVFPDGGSFARHPSQLYEAALEGILLFSLIAFLTFRLRWPEKKPGAQMGVFLAGYGLARIIVECFREPDGHIGYLLGGSTLGQWLSLPLLMAGLGIVMICYQPKKHLR